MRIHLRRHILRALFSRRWPRRAALEDGYAVVLPSPMDMPFLLRFALEGLQHLDTRNCKQILVVPDAWGSDGGGALRRVVAAFDDPRITIASPRLIDYGLVRVFNSSSCTHWLALVNGTARVGCTHAYLHDADAFHVERGGLERHYDQCRDRGMYTLGVIARIDECFLKVGYSIPATWELMYSVEWALRHGAFAFKPGRRMTPHGPLEFDTMLLPQYLDYASGKVGVMETPPDFVHIGGAIGAYRVYQERRRRSAARPIADQWLRLVFLALLEDLIPDPSGRRALPMVEELARGLNDPTAPVTYATVEAAHAYPAFRENIEALCRAPIFQADRANQIWERLQPFEEHYRAGWAGLSRRNSFEEPHYVRYGIA